MINNNIIINKNALLKEALIKLDENTQMQTLMVEDNNKIIGTVTDGDIRRGLIEGLTNANVISEFMLSSFTFLTKGKYDQDKIAFIKSKKLQIIPVLNSDGTLFRIINFNKVKTILPIDAVIMAGGEGTRLLPLTKDTPKPMLKIGGKPIMEYNVDLLKSYGISHVTLSVKYLKEIIEEYYQDGASKELEISYITEDKPLGTIGAVKQIKEFHNDYVLVMNSDLLTNINLEQMFDELVSNQADMIVATVDYKVQIPYGIIESDGARVKALVEKPTYTYYSNAGIYMFKKEIIEMIPDNSHFNATDLLEKLIQNNHKVTHFPITNYWLDIGKHEDYKKAQEDIKHIKL